MLPAYKPGRIIVARPVAASCLRGGDVVIIRHQGIEKIKRIHAVRHGQLFVVGDNPSCSTDSRSFGWLPNEAAAGKVIWPRH